MTALTRTVSGEKQINSGNLEILPGIGKPEKFSGNMRYFRDIEQRFDITCYQIIYTVICTLCMPCILCTLTLENGLTPHDMKDQSATFPTKIA